MSYGDGSITEIKKRTGQELQPQVLNVKAVQTRLGHASPSITLAWYAHAMPEQGHEAAQMPGSLFNKKEKSPVTHFSRMSPECPLSPNTAQGKQKGQQTKQAC